MFLIAKIVRGRRLLHELEQREKNQAAAAALEAAQSITQVSRRLAARHQHLSGDVVENSDEVKTNQKTERRKSGRRKTHACGSVDLSVNSSDRLSVRRTSSMPSLCDGVPRPVGSTLKHYNYDDKLNRLQRRALRFTWHRLHTRNGGKRVENVFEEVYDRLVRVLPSVKDIFTTRMFLCAMSRNETASLRDHARVTVKMFDLALKSIDVENSKREDTGSPLDPKIIGRSHGLLRPYGLTGQHWEKLGEIIIDVVLAQEAVRDLPGAGQAWVIFTACLVDQLRAGFDECRGANQGLTKRNTVLYHATKHLYDLEQLESERQNMADTTLLSSTAPSTSNDDSMNPETMTSQQSGVDMPVTYNIHCRRNVQQIKRRTSKACSRNENDEVNEYDVTTAPPSEQTSSRRRQSNLETPTSTACMNRNS